MRARNFVAAALAAVAVFSTAARGGELEEKLRSKLEQPFAKNIPWVMDYEEALRQAKKEGKLVFAYFSRSFYP